MTFAPFPAGKISRRQEHGVGMAVSCPQWNCTCWVQTRVWGEECPTSGAWPLHLCWKGKKADRRVINQGNKIVKRFMSLIFTCNGSVSCGMGSWRGCSLMGWHSELCNAETAEGGEVAAGWYRPPLPIFSEEKWGEEMVNTICWYKQKANVKICEFALFVSRRVTPEWLKSVLCTCVPGSCAVGAVLALSRQAEGQVC